MFFKESWQPKDARNSKAQNKVRFLARDQMAAYKYPRSVEIVDELPKTTSGKILRRLLQPPPAPSTATGSG